MIVTSVRQRPNTSQASGPTRDHSMSTLLSMMAAWTRCGTAAMSSVAAIVAMVDSSRPRMGSSLSFDPFWSGRSDPPRRTPELGREGAGLSAAREQVKRELADYFMWSVLTLEEGEVLGSSPSAGSDLARVPRGGCPP